MIKTNIKRSIKSGLPPGTLVHIGEKKTGAIKIKIIDYNETGVDEREITNIDDCLSCKDSSTVSWIDIEGVHDLHLIEKMGEHFGLHPLTLEDVVNTVQRPKAEFFDNYIYIVLNMLYPGKEDSEIKSEQVSIICGSNFIISFQEGIDGDVFDPLRERIRTGKGRIRKRGADYLAYSMIDAIIDNYFIVLENLEGAIEDTEEKLVSNPTTETLRTLHTLKREIIFLRKSVWPLREVISGLEREESPLIQESTELYLRDVYDHVIQIIDTIETYRDILAGMLDIYLSSISNRMNEVMKVLTIIATIFIPLTFIAGVYGMNFKYMPELEWEWGYPAIWGVMIVIGVFMLFCFRKKKWL
ncbi:MAG: magnesium/cobalt transporter CorA [Candidatus Schekmanbacteria bacterium]|nr:magnesium/cobalt transporter CorA [Candidatus Schekmanbacteria bacterium]